MIFNKTTETNYDNTNYNLSLSYVTVKTVTPLCMVSENTSHDMYFWTHDLKGIFRWLNVDLLNNVKIVNCLINRHAGNCPRF